MKRDGIAVARLEDLAPGEPALAQMQSFGKARLGEQKNGRDIREYREIIASRREKSGAQSDRGKLFKDFRVNLWNMVEGAAIDLDANPFSPFLLSSPVLAVVNGYMELAAKFAYGTLMTTIQVPPDTPEYLSQRWHRDPEDKRFVRVFIYLNDVLEPSTGPFMYVMGSHGAGRWGRVFPQTPPAGRYPPLGAVEHIVHPKDIRMCLGEAGAVVFADTAGIHKGGYSTGSERLMFAATFFSDAALQSPAYRVDRPRLAGFAPLARYALA